MATSSDLGEFDLIARYFAPLAGEAGLGLLDDVACFTPPTGKDLVLSKDLLIAETHFFSDDDPADVAFKAISANVSDIVAKGAEPLGYLLGLSLPKDLSSDWIAIFCAGLSEAQAEYSIELFGGDTTATKGLVAISVTIMGQIDTDTLVRRSGAKIGDRIYVTGSLGDAAMGLRARLGQGIGHEVWTRRFLRPTARMQVGMALQGVASASADVSDGLLADLGHICRASGLGCRVYEADLPISRPTREVLTKDHSIWPAVWSGGEDYEIVFTAPATQEARVAELSNLSGTAITCIGQVCEGSSIELVDSKGEIVHFESGGYSHF